VKLWDDFVESQALELGRETVDQWLKSLKVVHFDAANLYLEAKDAFQAAWFEEHMRYKVRKHLKSPSGRIVKVHLATDSSRPQKKAEWAPVFSLAPDQLDPYATFVNYIPGLKNTTSLSLLQSSFGSFNPIYIFGPKGSGKTHLLMASAHALSGKKSLFVRAETFTAHVVAAIRSGNMHQFRQMYREAEVLIVDDIDQLAYRSSTQEEFFHTFNALHNLGRQIILSGKLPPHILVGIEPRLTSRFEWGIAIAFYPTEEREELLVNRALALQFPLSTGMKRFLLKSFTSHPAALIRALEAVVLRSHLEKIEITEERAEVVLADLLLQETLSQLTPQKIVEAVGSRLGVTPDEVLGKSQTQECVLPRQIAMYFCRERLKLPYLKIGEIFGRDHSTVMTSVKAVEGRKSDLLPLMQEIAQKF